jgi:hypothetical protein
VITGFYFDGNLVAHGFVRSPDGALTSFDPVGSVDTEPISIDPGGEISGVYSDANHVSHRFLRDPEGAVTSFDAPDSNGGTFVTGMSPRGEITGYYNDWDEPLILSTGSCAHGMGRIPRLTCRHVLLAVMC